MSLTSVLAPKAAPHTSPANDNVNASLKFTIPQATKPHFESASLTGGDPKYHFETEDRVVTVHDMRPLAADLSLDREGFELRRAKTQVDDLYDDGAIEEDYNSEIEALLKAATGADRVAIFDHTRRFDGPGGEADRNGQRGPAGRLHVDYTATSGPRRAGDILGAAEVERILTSGGRIMQVNVWRPIAGPVRRAPLALADAASVAPEDLIATDQIFPHRVGEVYNLAYNPEQRWYWAPEMERDEVLLIKGWDSLDDGSAKFTPHSAFQLSEQGPDVAPRESIETRTYLVFEAPAH